MKKQYKSSITKDHEIKKKYIFDGIPLKGYVARNQNKHCGKITRLMTLKFHNIANM